MAFADIAKRRGHEVKIYEKEDRLGGQLLMAMEPPYKSEIKDFVRHLEKQMNRLQIPVRLNCEVTEEFIHKEEADAVIIATGGLPWLPSVRGLDQDKIITYKDILTGFTCNYGKRIIIFGGGEIGCECAEYIYERSPDSEINIIKTSIEIAPEMEPIHRRLLIKRLSDKGIKVIVNTRVLEITDHGAILEREGKREMVSADMIVWAKGVCSNNGLAKQLSIRNISHLAIGDCYKVGNIEDGMLMAWKAGFKI